MAVVCVAHVGMGMLKLPVPVLVGMPVELIGIDSLKVFGIVAVLVMGIAAARIVPVAMGMIQQLMAMPVAVLLAQQQHHAGGHQHCSYHEWRCGGITEHQHGEQSAYKWGRGEEHRLTGRAQAAQG